MCDSFLNLSLEEDRSASMYVPEEPISSSTASSDETGGPEETRTNRRTRLNRFLESCAVTSRVGPYKKAWRETGSRTRTSHMEKARDAIVAVLDVVTPGDGALLWEALQSSVLVEKALETLSPVEEK